jgi:serine/threonine protein kinase
VLIYQMLLQQSPFRGEDEDEIYDAILADEPLYPIHMPRDSVSILQKLLTREPDQRLGSGPTDAQEVMSQPFFRNVVWDDIYNKRVEPPFLPQIKSATDTSNFDSEFTSVTPVLTPVQSGMFCSSAVVAGAGGEMIANMSGAVQFFRKPCRKSSAGFRTRPISSRVCQVSHSHAGDSLIALCLWSGWKIGCAEGTWFGCNRSRIPGFAGTSPMQLGCRDTLPGSVLFGRGCRG